MKPEVIQQDGDYLAARQEDVQHYEFGIWQRIDNPAYVQWADENPYVLNEAGFRREARQFNNDWYRWLSAVRDEDVVNQVLGELSNAAAHAAAQGVQDSLFDHQEPTLQPLPNPTTSSSDLDF